MGNEYGLTTYETDHGEVKLSPGIIRQYLVSGNAPVTDQEVAMFLTLCKYQRLNPFLREAYLIKYSDRDPASIVVGKDVHVKRASKHPHFDGIQSGVIVERSGDIVEREGSFTAKDDSIVGGWAIGHRKDRSIPRKITVSFEEYAVRKRDGNLNRSWTRMPGTMIVKVAEAQCLRAMFPEELQALYNAEEMQVQPDELPKQVIPESKTEEVEQEEQIEEVPEEAQVEAEVVGNGDMQGLRDAIKDLATDKRITDRGRLDIKAATANARTLAALQGVLTNVQTGLDEKGTT